MERVSLETCSVCGRLVWTNRMVGLQFKFGTEPLGSRESVDALLAGRSLHRLVGDKIHPAGPVDLADPEAVIVGEHGCAGFSRPVSPPVVQEPVDPPAGPQNRTPAAARGNSAGPATPRPSEPKPCQHCRSTVGVRHYAAGHRCPKHTPAALAGLPEPPEDPNGIEVVSIEVDGEVVWSADYPRGSWRAV